MIEAFLFISALIGTSYAAWSDLKTTEVSDVVSIAMASIGIGASFFYSLFTGDWSFVLSSLMVGTSFLALGLLLYFLGAWGGADALILGATGYMLHFVPSLFGPEFSIFWPYQMSFILNLFIVGALYSSLYSVYLAFKHGLFSKFYRGVIERKKTVFSLSLGYLLFTLMLPFAMGNLYSVQVNMIEVLSRSLASTLAVVGLFLLYIFFSTVQKDYMEKEISVDELEVGDVIGERFDFLENKSKGSKREEGVFASLKNFYERITSPKIKGLTEEELKLIRERKQKVTIRRGVTFIVSFPLAILITFILGDVLYNLFLLVY